VNSGEVILCNDKFPLVKYLKGSIFGTEELF